MSRAAQLKRRAAEYEQKRQYERALATYVQAIEAAGDSPDEADIPLYNRVGDIHLRLGDLEHAVTYYEAAADLYAEGGFFNNAIALCNKVLRHAPGRSAIYYKLGKISARKGFNSDAKQNFLEYAARMERAGNIDEAFRALTEFADLCPGQDDVRLMLADQLARAGRTSAALDQLQIVYESLVADDRATEAAATLDRIRALDPEFEPRAAAVRREEKREGLVFIDVDYEIPRGVPAAGLAPPDATATPHPLSPEEFGAVELPPPADEHVARGTLDASPLEGLTPLEDPLSALAAAGPLAPDDLAVAPPSGLEPTVIGDDGAGAELTPVQPSRPDDEFVDLAEWLRESQPPQNPRMTGEEEVAEPGAVQTDFAAMLETFKRGVAQNVDEGDSDAHYDLGVAYMEMGLLDEAIAEFQTALRGGAEPESRVRAHESLGQCFIERGEYGVAIESLQAPLHEPGQSDLALVGVLYLLGYASERLGRAEDAEAYYRRVYAVDIHFRDVAERLERMATP